jgi:cytochrome c556
MATLAMALVAACTPDGGVQPPSATATDVPADESLTVAGPGWTGLTEPDEIIEARRLLMIETQRLMEPIDTFAIGEPGDPAQLRSAARTIEPMMLALPHLFPPTTNLFDPALREPPTIALPAIWDRFAAFETFAESAERAAAALAAAEEGEPLRAASVRLRGACDTCHVAFTKPYTPPKVTDEDLSFDFESVLPNE